jgi:amidohydrolase
VKLVEPLSGSEDFSFFSNETPGFMFFLGSLKEGTTSGDHHTPTFLADDSAVPVGIRAMSTVLLDYLARESGQR